MSARFTHLVWQLRTQNPTDKLVLLMIADAADRQGYASLYLEEAAPLCALSTYALADCLTNLAQQGFIEKERLDRKQGKEIHVFRILEFVQPSAKEHQSEPLPPISVAYCTSSTNQEKPSPSSMHHTDGVPDWVKKELSFSGINSDEQQRIWDSFKHSIDFSQLSFTPLARLERYLQNWLQEQHPSPPKQQTTSLVQTKSSNTEDSNTHQAHFTNTSPVNHNNMQSLVSTHDLDEYHIPAWAEKAFKFSTIATDHLSVWQKFVLWHKSKANELLAISKLENKLKYWLANEKLNEDRKTRTKGYSGAPEQTQGDGHRRKLSPSERFRQQLIQQGKKPTF